MKIFFVTYKPIAMIRITIGISTNRWFDTQKQAAEFLCIKNSSKKAIQSRCRMLNYNVEF